MSSHVLAHLFVLATSAAEPVELTSWDVLGGGVTDGPVLFTARAGFSRWFDLGAEWPIADRLGVGPYAAVGHGHFVLEDAGEDPGIAVGARARYALLHEGGWSIGVTGGLGIRADLGEGSSLLVPLGIHALYGLGGRFMVGAGLDLEGRFNDRTRGPAPTSAPLLLSGLFEMHLLPGVGLTAEVGLGPAFTHPDIAFALSARVGVALRL